MPLDDSCYCRKLHALWKLGLLLQKFHYVLRTEVYRSLQMLRY